MPEPTLADLADLQDWEAACERLLGLTVIGQPSPASPSESESEAASEPSRNGCSAATPPTLPWFGQWHCRRCDSTVPGVLDRDGPAALRLALECPACGAVAETHHSESRFASAAASPAPTKPARRPRRAHLAKQPMPALPRIVDALCPECRGSLLARVFESRGGIWLERTCPQHGYFRDLLESDVRLFRDLDLASESDSRPAPNGESNGDGSLAVLRLDALDVDNVRRPDPRPQAKQVRQALRVAAAEQAPVCLETVVNRAANLDQVGPILRFAIRHADAVSVVVFRTATFARRVSLQQLTNQRCTLAEIARAVAPCVGADVGRDFAPLRTLASIPLAVGLTRQCATLLRLAAEGRTWGMYLLVSGKGRAIPLGRTFQLPRLIDIADDAAQRAAHGAPLAQLGWWNRLRFGIRLAACCRRVTRDVRRIPLLLLRAGRAGGDANSLWGNYRLLLVAAVRAPDRYSEGAPPA